jgi:hypothetical protein
MSPEHSVRRALGWFALILLGAAGALAQSPSPSPAATPTAPTWEDEIRRDHLPYHQLTVDDFPVRDRPGEKNDYYVQAFIEPRYGGFVYFNRGWVHAYIKNFQFFSGFDKSSSYRRKGFHEMKEDLPAAQAMLDLNEIRARELGTMPADGWPEYRGGTEAEVKAGLEARVRALCQAKYDQAQADIDALMKATDQGRDRKKLRKMAVEIRKRLDAMPKTSGPLPATPTSTPSVAPSATLAPKIR